MTPAQLWRQLSKRDRRAVLLGAGIVVPALVWVFAISPYLDAVRSRTGRHDTQQSLLAAERDLLAGRERYPRVVEDAAIRLQATAPALLDSRSVGVAVAELTQFVDDRAAASRFHLTATEPRPARRVDPQVVSVPLWVEGRSDLRGVLEFLELLEDGAKIVRVEDLRLRRVRASRPTTEPGMEVLSVRLSLTGYMVSPEGSPTERTSGGRGVASGAERTGRKAAGDLADRSGVDGGGP